MYILPLMLDVFITRVTPPPSSPSSTLACWHFVLCPLYWNQTCNRSDKKAAAHGRRGYTNVGFTFQESETQHIPLSFSGLFPVLTLQPSSCHPRNEEGRAELLFGGGTNSEGHYDEWGVGCGQAWGANEGGVRGGSGRGVTDFELRFTSADLRPTACRRRTRRGRR
eukprot:Hpha_TRINITY_DN15054_c1_g1::TRINITY_DN15054_c1_g1_i1::g.125915::m.125915